MATTDYPEIDIDELMQRIRAEATQRKASLDNAGGAPSIAPAPIENDAETALARLADPAASLQFKDAYRLTDFLDYQDVDFIRLAYRRLLNREPDRNGLEHYLNQLRTGSLSKVEILGRLRYSAEGRARRVKIHGLLAPFASRLIGRVPVIGYAWRLLKAGLRLPVSARNFERFETHAALQNQQLRRQIDALTGRLETTLRDILQRKADAAALTELQQALAAKADAAALTELQQALAAKADAAALTELQQALQFAHQEIKTVLQSYDLRVQNLKRNVLEQQRRLMFLLEEVRKRMPEPLSSAQLETLVGEEEHVLDSFYVTFEDSFRGSRDDIKQRVAVYLPLIEQAVAGAANGSLLDLGCGRGEWLELLKENGVTARGLDLNRIMVEQCRELGLEVIESEAINYLRNLEANSLGAVTGMHIIEHIPFKSLIKLFDETLRVLKPGGVMIFETPNPENLNVGACNFYTDPTHQKPLPPEMTKFLVEARGFVRVDIMRLHPYPESRRLQTGDVRVQEIINNALFGSQDYAVIGYKA